MADADKDFKVKVATEGEASGAKKVEQSLDDVAKAHAKAGETAKKAAKDTNELEKAHHELHEIMHMIGHETAPEIGRALAGAFYGPLGGIISFGSIVELVMENIKKKAEEAARAIELAWEAQRQAADDMLASVGSLHDDLEKAKQPADAIKTSFDDSKAALESMIEAHGKILKALEEEEVAAAGGDPDKVASIHARFANVNRQQGVHDQQARLNLEQQEIARRQANQTGTAGMLGMEGIANVLAAAVAKMKTDPEFLKAQAENTGKKFSDFVGLEGARKFIDDAGGLDAAKMQLEEYRRNQRIGATFGGGAGGIPSPLEHAIDLVTRANAFQANADLVSQHTEAIASAERAHQSAADAATKNQEAITNLTSALDTHKKQFSTAEAGEEIQRAISISLRALRGGSINQAESDYVRSIGSRIGGVDVTTGQAEQMFQVAANNQTALSNFINRLTVTFNKMPDLTPVLNYLADLESKFSQQQSQINNLSLNHSH